MAEGFGRAEEAEALGKPTPVTEGGAAFLGSLLGVPTALRSCGAAVAETHDDAEAAGRLARAVHRGRSSSPPSVSASLRAGPAG